MAQNIISLRSMVLIQTAEFFPKAIILLVEPVHPSEALFFPEASPASNRSGPEWIGTKKKYE